eukprot:TRINITY_DN11787_c0_g4_i2.p6 TRINITY_DN11787_c0_g4~~TRINITY_DN11787_c0_g4_i2.p6  ORF type:complete len:130 (+),score=18.50 TRINITY_DN11787_c0_g4_i2:474-863(+)
MRSRVQIFAKDKQLSIQVIQKIFQSKTQSIFSIFGFHEFVDNREEEDTPQINTEEIDKETRQPVEIENQKPDEAMQEDAKEEEKPTVSIPKPLKVSKSPLTEKHCRNLDVNVCEAMVKVVFPWAACVKN